jgi:ABC-2 type transport system permease protein
MLVPTCLLLLIFLLTAYAMGMELKENTATELVAAAGGNPFIALVGKMLPHIAVWIVVMGAYMVYTFGVLNFPHPGGWGVIVLLTVLSVLAAVGFGVFMFGLLPALRMSMSLCSLWGVLSFSMVGTAFPVLAMDAPLQVLANIFPMRHFFLIYETCIFANNPLSDVALNIAALVLFAAAPVFVILRINRAYKEYVYME